MAVDRGKLVIEAYEPAGLRRPVKLGDTAATRSIRQELLTTAIEGLDKVASSIGGRSSRPRPGGRSSEAGRESFARLAGRTKPASSSSSRSGWRRTSPPTGPATPGPRVRDAYLRLGELILRDERPEEAKGCYRRTVQEAETVEAAGRIEPEGEVP